MLVIRMYDEILNNIFLQALIVGVICIAIRLGFQRQNPDKFFWVQMVIVAIAGSELVALIFYFSSGGVVEWWMYLGFLVGGLAFPKLPDLFDYVFSGNPLTIEAIWEKFLEEAANEYNPLLVEILQYLKEHWEDLNPEELLNYLKQREIQTIQQQLIQYQKRLQELQKP